MSRILRLDHAGITVADLQVDTKFFVGLGLEVAGGPMFLEGEFLDTVCGIPNARTQIAMLKAPDGGTTVEFSSFVRPDHAPGQTTAMAYVRGP